MSTASVRLQQLSKDELSLPCKQGEQIKSQRHESLDTCMDQIALRKMPKNSRPEKKQYQNKAGNTVNQNTNYNYIPGGQQNSSSIQQNDPVVSILKTSRADSTTPQKQLQCDRNGSNPLESMSANSSLVHVDSEWLEQDNAKALEIENLKGNHSHVKQMLSKNIPQMTSTIIPTIQIRPPGESTKASSHGWVPTQQQKWQASSYAQLVKPPFTLNKARSNGVVDDSERICGVYAKMEDKVKSCSSRCNVLAIKPEHVFGVDLQSLSEAQLEELEQIHFTLLRRCMAQRLTLDGLP